MKLKKRVSNPLLAGSMELWMEENSQEHFNMFLEQLQKAELLTPALIDPAPVEEEDGGLKLLPGSSIQILMLSASNGHKYFMGFTDEGEYRSWVEKNRECPTFALKLDDYIKMLLQKDEAGNMCPARGIVVNPYGANLALDKDLLANIMAGRTIRVVKGKDERK